MSKRAVEHILHVHQPPWTPVDQNAGPELGIAGSDSCSLEDLKNVMLISRRSAAVCLNVRLFPFLYSTTHL